MNVLELIGVVVFGVAAVAGVLWAAGALKINIQVKPLDRDKKDERKP